MAIGSIKDAQLNSFEEVNGKVARRITGAISGSFSPSGLNISGKITEVTLNSTTWTALPSSALLNRNSLNIQNRSGIDIKINYDNTQVGYVGIEIVDLDERSYDITDSIIIYGKAKAGTPTVTIEELS